MAIKLITDFANQVLVSTLIFLQENGLAAKVSKETLGVNVEFIHTNAVNQEFHQDTVIESNFAVPVTSQDRSFTVDDATGFAELDRIQIMNGVVEPQFPTILDITGNVITIDRPIDLNYTTADGIRKIFTNLAVDGSVTPQAFRITGEQSTALTQITRVLFEMSHSGSGDLGTFGGIDALTNGVIVRVFKGQFNFWKTIANWRTNGDIKRDMGLVTFDDRSGGNGVHGTSGLVSFLDFGMVGEYDPDAGDFLEILIQDDLSDLDSFTVNAQGHTKN